MAVVPALSAPVAAAGAARPHPNFTCLTGVMEPCPAPPAGAGAGALGAGPAQGDAGDATNSETRDPGRSGPTTAVTSPARRGATRRVRPSIRAPTPPPAEPSPRTHPLPRQRGGRTSSHPGARHGARRGALRWELCGAGAAGERGGTGAQSPLGPAARRGRGRSEDGGGAALPPPSPARERRARRPLPGGGGTGPSAEGSRGAVPGSEHRDRGACVVKNALALQN